MDEMDALPPEERLPNWDETRRLMERRAPRVGEAAPDFCLPREDGSGEVCLSDYDRPVVLIFGSWT